MRWSPTSRRRICAVPADGLRQSLDTVGACAGPLLAVLFMVAFANDIRAVLWIAVVPAALAVLLLVLGVEDVHRPRSTRTGQAAGPARRSAVGSGGDYWWVVLIGRPADAWPGSARRSSCCVRRRSACASRWSRW